NYVGKRGERVIDALIAHREKLEPWIKEWLERFGMAKDFKVEEIAKGTRRFQIMLHDSHIPKLEATLADVGFGISQVLPILVQAKLLPKDAIFMVEQPEIHLHPKAQAAMGDFLIDVALEDKKTLLVETHSDLVIARIANRIAEGKISHKDVMVFYFHPQKDGTKILQIEFDEDGIPTQEFPEGFLAEVSDETARHFDILSRR
ncbi:AAA family ATPase, partial [Hydrogenimonas sp.]